MFIYEAPFVNLFVQHNWDNLDVIWKTNCEKQYGQFLPEREN